jgi:hypothetical protein
MDVVNRAHRSAGLSLDRFWRLGLVLLFLLGLGNGLWWAQRLPQRWYEGQDSEEYRIVALNLLNGRGFSREVKPPYAPTLYREPGYPAFVAAIFAVTGTSDQAVAVAQSALLGVAAILAALLARHVFRDARIGLLGGFWTALSPDLGDYARHEMSEALFVPLFLLAALVGFLAWRSGSVVGHAASALSFALAGYVRIMAVLTGVVLQGLSLLVFRSRTRHLIVPSLVFGTTLAAALLPWMIRNQLELDRFSFAGRGGAYLLPRADKAAAPLEKQLEYLGLAAWVATYPFSEAVLPFSRLHKEFVWDGALGQFAHLSAAQLFQGNRCPGSDDADPGQSINLEDECDLRAGIQMIVSHPLQYVYMTPVEWVRLTFYPYPSRLGLIRNWTVWLGIAAIVVSIARRRFSREQLWLLLFILSYTLPSIAGDSLDRYGIPLIPLYSLFAAAGVVQAADTVGHWLRQRRSPTAPLEVAPSKHA